MIDYILANDWLVWLIAAVFFLVIELASAALTSIWFVPSAVIVSFCSIFIKNIYFQIILFIVLSAIFLVISRKMYKKRANAADDDNLHLIGKTAVTKEKVNAENGKVLVGDIYWRAVSDTPIEENESVIIIDVKGTTLIVTKKYEKE